MIANNRGSKRLVGAASLRYRMPAIFGSYSAADIAHRVEQQLLELSAAGSIPAILTTVS